MILKLRHKPFDFFETHQFMNQKKLSLFLLLFLLLFAAFALLGPFSKLSSIQLKAEGLSPDVEKQILSQLKNYEGKALWRLSLKKMAKEIQPLDQGLRLSIVRKFPNTMTVSLREKDTALLLLKKGSFYAVFSDGGIGKQKKVGEFMDFPVLRSEHFWTDMELRKRAISVINSLPGKSLKAEDEELTKSKISEISYNKTRKSFWLYLISSPFVLELSKAPSPQKIKNINFVLSYLKRRDKQQKNKQGNNKPAGGLIIAEQDKKIIVKNKNLSLSY